MDNNQNSDESTGQVQKDRQKILFVEDDVSLARAYQTKLTMEGFEADLAIDGQEALEKLENNEYDLILLDLILPKANGFDILKQLRASAWPTAKKPVIVFSNLGNASDITKSRDLGADDYVIKSNLSPNEMVAKIREHLK